MDNNAAFADLQIRIREPIVHPSVIDAAEGPETPNGAEKTVYPVEITLNQALEFERGYLSPEAIAGWQFNKGDPSGAGKALFNLLLGNETIRGAWSQVKGMYPRHRVRLRVDFAAPELNAIPWELMIDHVSSGGMGIGGMGSGTVDSGTANRGVPQQATAVGANQLAATAATPFVRYQAEKHPIIEPLVERPIKMLVAIANPKNLEDYGLEPVDVELELALLQSATAGLDIQTKMVENCTIQELETELRNGYHILHFVGHGAYNEDRDEAVIYMADAEERVNLVSAHFEASLIARQYATNAFDVNSLRLVCMVSCQSATRDPGDAFRGFAPKLIAAGVPVVVAMQDLISMRAARIFTATFYRRLLEHGLVDLACNEARSALLTANSSEAYIPVLYTRLQDGTLFAPDPIYATLRSMLQDEIYQEFDPAADHYLDLPIEVTHMALCDRELTTQAWKNIHAFAAMQSEMKAGIPIQKAIRGICNGTIVHPDCRPNKSKVMFLVGDYGSSKATQLRYLAWQAMSEALQLAAEQNPAVVVRIRGVPSDEVLIPVYVDLRGYQALLTQLHNPAAAVLAIEHLILAALKAHWPGITLSELLRQFGKRRFRFLFAKGEYLSTQLRTAVLQQISAFIQRLEQEYSTANDERIKHTSATTQHINHQIVITLSPSHFERDEILYFTREQQLAVHLLVIQRLRVGEIRHFLLHQARSRPTSYAGRLLSHLDNTGLYDLASIPWFLVDMVNRAKAGQLPRSRVELLHTEVQEALIQMGSSYGTQRYAFDALCACAWKMSMESRETLHLSELFDILNNARCNRDFPLEIFFQELIKTELLTNMGNGEVQFTYSRIRAYCCAHALVHMENRAHYLNHIVATLGRLSYLNWWGDVLIYVCGLLADDPITLNSLLAPIVYGSNLLESEQIFLAAHCLLEVLPLVDQAAYAGETKRTALDPALIGHVNAALLWRLNKENESSLTYRDRAALLLGYLVPLPDLEADTPSMPAAEKNRQIDATLLVETAYKPQPGNDIGNMNWAAVLAFLRVTNTEQQKRLLATIDPALAAMMGHWREGNATSLIELLQTPQADDNRQGIAALALADLYSATSDQPGSAMIFQTLIEAFYTIKAEMPLWSLAHALATLDSTLVIKAVVLPYRQEVERRQLTVAAQWQHRKYITYLIGLLRVHDPAIDDLLLENFALCKRRRVTEIPELIIETINALGRIADPKDKGLLETLAVGNFAELLPTLSDSATIDARMTRVYTSIQRAAVDAMASIGDDKSVDQLRKLRAAITRKTLTVGNGNTVRRHNSTDAPIPFYYRDLNLAIDRTTDVIYSRMHRTH